MLTKERISCYAIDCDELIYSMGKWNCLKKCAVTNGRICIRCKFDKLRKIEDAIREGEKNG